MSDQFRDTLRLAGAPAYLTRVADRISFACHGLEPDLARIYAVLALAKAPDVTNEDVHHAWCAWTLARRPDHRSLLPFADLPPDVQELGTPYRDAINDIGRVARQELRG